MKVHEIQVGETYYTRIAGYLQKVVVIREITVTSIRRTYTAFVVRRVDETKELPKPRRASALHTGRF
jgi:ribosomal protein S19E (S16A)